MTPEQIEGIIKFGTVVITAAAATTTVLWKYIDHLNIKAKEQSAGMTAIAGLLESDRKIQLDIEKLKRSDELHDKEIETLEQDYKKLTFQIFELFKLK